MIGDLIRKRRKEMGMSQRELAKQVNLSTSTIGMIETNKRRLGNKYCSSFSKILGIPIKEMEEKNVKIKMDKNTLFKENIITQISKMQKKVDIEIKETKKKLISLEKEKKYLEKFKQECKDKLE